MIRFILSLFMPFRWFIEKMGADYNQFIRILQLKLTLDDRRIKVATKKNKNAQEKMLIKQSLGQIFMGVFFSVLLIMIKSPFTFFYLAHTFIMALMAMMIISEFTTILFDTTENAIIQPLPIKGNTMSLARNAHIFIYLTLMAFNLSVLSIIVAIIKFGIISGLIFISTIFLNVLFTLFIANILYLGIMRIARGEQLKNLLMYFQVAIAIFFMAAYQLGMRLIDKTQIQDMVLPVHWYTFLVPPAFFSGFIVGLSTLNFDLQHLIFITEAIVLPILAIFFTGKYLTPVFNRKLMDLEQGDRASKVKIESANKSLWYRLMSSIFVYNSDEKAAFKMMWKMVGRERLFKQSFLPSTGFILVMIISSFAGKPFDLDKISQSNMYLLVLYSSLICVFTIASSLMVGPYQSAVWIFKTLPFTSSANFFKGTIKAAFVRFIIPIYLVISVIVCIIWGIKVFPDILIAFLCGYLFSILNYYIQLPIYPFSMEKSAIQGGSIFFKFFGVIVAALAAGFLHNFLLGWFPFANLLLIPVYVGAIWYIDQVFVYRKINWKAVDLTNNFS
ncbi:MAG TPA: hypothetical protein VFC65_19890 [Prolixibacteraceae bacterium]|nr:hypothetical protein [Prolixibacteraceae bacterium]